MPEPAATDILTPVEAIRDNVSCICVVLDDDVVQGLQRLKGIFPMRKLLSESLRPFINTFLPIVDLYEQGRLTADCLPEAMKGLDSLITRTDVAKARLDKKVRILERHAKQASRRKG